MLGTLIAGFFIGIVFVFSALLNFYLKAQNFELRKQIKELGKEQADSDAKLQKLAATVQEREKLPYVINISEQVTNTIADRVCNRVQVILHSQNEAALAKMS